MLDVSILDDGEFVLVGAFNPTPILQDYSHTMCFLGLGHAHNISPNELSAFVERRQFDAVGRWIDASQVFKVGDYWTIVDKAIQLRSSSEALDPYDIV